MLLLNFFCLLMYAISHYIYNIMYKSILCIHSCLSCVNYLFPPNDSQGCVGLNLEVNTSSSFIEECLLALLTIDLLGKIESCPMKFFYEDKI